jgi:flagellar export protein FliJ
MAKLKPLIKLKKFAVEEKQKALAALLREVEFLAAEKQKAIDSLDTEALASTAIGTVEAMVAFANYVTRVKEKVAEIDRQLQMLERKITRAQDEMRDAFAEVKKIEIVEDLREKKERKKRDKKENDFMDEVGLRRFEDEAE